MLTNNLRGFNLVLISIPFFILILNPAIMVYYFAQKIYSYISVSWILPLIFYFSLLSYAILFMIESYIILKILFNPKNKEGTFNIHKTTPEILYYSISEILMKINERIFSMLLIPQSVYGNIIFKLFGKHCGKKSLINPIYDPYLTSIGDECIIGFGVIILGHEISGQRIILKEVKIGNRVTIGANSIISPGVIIEDDVIVGAKSYVKKNSILKKGGFYVGCPAELKEKKSF
ncbi:MAG: DapH/DapD/GlmU-related protein [Candidatus Nanoarchaeia archaeon]